MVVTNIAGIQSFADMYSCIELEAIARQYIFRHFLDVIQHDEFLNLSEERLMALLQSNSLQVSDGSSWIIEIKPI